MDQHLSWGKAYIVSAAVHLVIFLLLAIGLAVAVAEQEQQVYEIDLQASDFSQGSGHEGGGSGTGSGTGSGDGTGDGQGVGSGSGAGQGSGNGNVSGTGSAPFDTNGFWAAVNANKEYPYMAMKRRLEGTTTIVTTISASGAITSVSVASSSGHGMLDDAAVAAAYAVGSYPNPTGGTVSVTTNVSFNIR